MYGTRSKRNGSRQECRADGGEGAWCGLCAVLLVAGVGGALASGVAPGVTVRIIGGQVIERPTADPGGLIHKDLYPDKPFVDPLEPSSLSEFRAFYSQVGPSLDLGPGQLDRIHRLAAENPKVKGQVDALVAGAEAWLVKPVPRYRPSRWHWLRAPREEAEHIEQQAAALATLRRSCALAFALTGEDRFAEKAWSALQAYIGHFYTYGVFRMPYWWQSPWDSGYEVYDAAACYDLIAHWEGLRPLDHALVYTYLRRLGQRVAYAVELSPVIGSQQVMWTCNLGCLALYAPTMPEASRWRELVEERMYSVMADFMTDGGQIECDPDMHAFTLRYIVRYARLAARHGDEEFLRRKWDENEVSIEGGLDWVARIATPLGETPAINDSRRRALADDDYFLDAINSYRRRDWLRAGKIEAAGRQLLHPVDPAIEPRDPAYTSVLLPDTGFAVMRDGWDERDNYLLLDYGRHGGAHGHFDKLNIIMYAQGQPWVLDAGSSPHYSVYTEEHEGWHRQTIAHNTVLIDEQSQRPVDGELVAWHTQREFDIAAAEHTGYPDAIHRRTVFHPRGGYFLVLDEVENLSSEERRMECLFHVHGRRESGTAGRVVFWREGGYGLSLLPAKGLGVRGVRIGEGLCIGCDGVSASILAKPGGGPWKPGDPGWAYIPYIGFKMHLPPKGTRTCCVALVPFRNTEPTSSVQLLDGRLAHVVEIRIGDIRDRIFIRRRGAPEGMARGMGLCFDGKYAFVREEAGKTTVMEWVEGTSLSIE